MFSAQDLNLHPVGREFDHHSVAVVLITAHLLRNRKEAPAIFGTPDAGIPGLSIDGGSDRRPTPRVRRWWCMPGRNGREHPTALPRHSK